MSHWNYRITREWIESEVESGYLYAIRELHYRNDDDKKPYAWSADPRTVTAENPVDIATVLGMMSEATYEPVWDISKRKWIPFLEALAEANDAAAANNEEGVA